MLSVWHLLILLLYAFLVCFPLARILKRLGVAGWWSLIALVPLVNLVALWIFAYSRWPRDAAGN